ncbi:hypothetical protein CCP4SC76_260005 [Gammaproteobacteria bacterium]
MSCDWQMDVKPKMTRGVGMVENSPDCHHMGNSRSGIVWGRKTRSSPGLVHPLHEVFFDGCFGTYSPAG